MPKVTGLAGVIAAETALSLVDGEKGRLVYRGYWAKELALHHTFEEAAYLLWHGKLPNEAELDRLKQQFKQFRILPDYIERVIESLPPDMEMMSVVRTAVSARGQASYTWPPTVEQAIEITAMLPTVIAYRSRQLEGKPRIEPDPSLDHVANYLYMLSGRKASAAQVRSLEAYFVLTMEHGMNASTFAARVIASTQSDLASAVSGAIGAMKGPLHGGAPTEVIHMLNEIGAKSNAEPWLRSALEQGERIMGFGHRIYKTRDPRAEALREITAQLSGDDEWLDLARHVEQTAIALLEEYKPGRKLYTNVEFYAAAILRAVEMPSSLFTPTFTASRAAGWTAHVLEQAENNRIFRPESLYVGPVPD